MCYNALNILDWRIGEYVRREKKHNYRRKKTIFVGQSNFLNKVRMFCFIFILLFSFVIKHLQLKKKQPLPNFIVENPNVKQLRNSKPDLRQTHRADTREYTWKR